MIRAIREMRCGRTPTLWLGLATWLLRGRIRERCGAMLWSLLSDHRAKLRTWLAAGLERITNAYEAQAALFRDRLRAAGDGQLTDASIGDLETDLNLLQQTTPIAPPAGNALHEDERLDKSTQSVPS